MPTLRRTVRAGFASARPHGAAGWLIAVLALLATLAGGVGLIAHFRAPGGVWVLGVSAAAPYLMTGAVIAFLLFLLGRLWLPASAALVLACVCVATQLPLYVASSPPANAATVTVMTSNLRLGNADPAAVVAAVRRHHVDVLMLEELTAGEQRRLIAAGLDKALPHHISAPSFAATGTGLWSRFPLTHTVRRPDFAFNFVTARIAVPTVARPVQLAAAHMAGPYPYPTNWHHDMAHLPSVLRVLGDHGTALVGGDFNATPDVVQFRALLNHGWADGAEQAGAGYTRTYPSDRAFPPLIAIDHVLTHGAVATSATTVEIPGSDHRALVETVAVPRSRTAR